MAAGTLNEPVMDSKHPGPGIPAPHLATAEERAALHARVKERFGEFTDAWGARCPAIVRLWDNARLRGYPTVSSTSARPVSELMPRWSQRLDQAVSSAVPRCGGVEGVWPCAGPRKTGRAGACRAKGRER